MTTSHRYLSEGLLSDVLASTPTDAALGFRDIWKRLGMWAPATVRHALVELHARGLVIRDGTDRKWLWRKPAPSKRRHTAEPRRMT